MATIYFVVLVCKKGQLTLCTISFQKIYSLLYLFLIVKNATALNVGICQKFLNLKKKKKGGLWELKPVTIKG